MNSMEIHNLTFDNQDSCCVSYTGMSAEMLHQLGVLAIERRPEACLGCGFEHKCSISGCAVINEALRALKERTK